MSIIVGGTNGVTFPDTSNLIPANVDSQLSPEITNASNILTINGRVVIDGTNGIYRSVRTDNTAQFYFNAIIASNILNYNLKNSAIAGGWNQTSPLVATITVNSGIYVGSSTIATPSFTTGSTFPTGSQLTLINNGYIIGRSGTAGAGGIMPTGSGSGGGAGGVAITAAYALSITNNSIIGGGGGGGAGQNASSAADGASGGAGAGSVSTTVNYLTGQAGFQAGGNLGAASSGAGGACTTSGSNANITWTVIGTRAGSLL